MPGPGGPVNDLILRLMQEGGHRLNARSSSGLRNRMTRIQAGGDVAPGPLPRPPENVLPGPGSNPPISRDPWFEDAYIKGASGKPDFAGIKKEFNLPARGDGITYKKWLAQQDEKTIYALAERMGMPVGDLSQNPTDVTRAIQSMANRLSLEE